MQWDDPSDYPGTMSVAHTNGATGVAWLELTPGDPAQLERWLHRAHVSLRLVDGVPGVHAMGIRTRHGEYEIRP